MVNPWRKNLIIKQAESIGLQYLKEGVVNLESIADDNDILYSYKKLKKKDSNAFNGLIMHKNDRFMIFLNMSKLKDKKSPRARFTFAHELGHYFIKSHNKILRTNQSLTYKGADNVVYSYTEVEQEANLFASNLIMPKSAYITASDDFSIGFNQVVGLAEKFGASIQCSAYHYVNCNVRPCILIRNYQNKLTKSISISMQRKLSRNSDIILNPNRGSIERTSIKLNESLSCSQSLSLLSSWVRNVDPGSKKDTLVIEQKMDLGTYGEYILVIPVS